MVLHSSSAGRDARRNLVGGLYTPRPAKGDQPPSLLDRDHRDRRNPGLDRDQLFRHQVVEPPPEGPPGAHPEGAPMTELIRSDAPRRSSMGALAIGGAPTRVLRVCNTTVCPPGPTLHKCAGFLEGALSAGIIWTGLFLL